MHQEQLKVITYNIYVGFTNEAEEGMPAGEDRKKMIREWLADEQPDIVAFQELNGYTYQKLEQESRGWDHTHTYLLNGISDFHLGISSRYPIEVRKEISQNMWHGLLHVSTGGIEVIVTHFSPFTYKLRHREADIVLQQVAQARQREYEVLVMGDLNSLSPDDKEAIGLSGIISDYARRDQEKDQIQNLKKGLPDYDTIRKFKDAGLTDLQVQQRKGSMRLVRPRLDYIWASESLAHMCSSAEWHTEEPFYKMSDHFPQSAEFQVP